MIFRLWFLIIIYFCSYTALSAQLKSINLQQQGMQTSLYLKLDGQFTYRTFFLSHPDRVVVDLKETQLAVNLQQLNLIHGIVNKVRSGYPDSKTLRLVFEVSQKVQLHSMLWRSNGPNKEIRIDISQSMGRITPRTVSQSLANQTLNVKPSASGIMINKEKKETTRDKIHQTQPIMAAQKPIKISSRPTKLRDVIVVLDAGHGGKDPGAKGMGHSQEKDVVLAITLKLKQLIDRQPGMHAVLTRSGDYYVGLRQRLKITRRYNGDIFVAIHADAFNNSHSSGASVFALSQRGATSEAARWLAEKENYSELGGVNLGDLDDQNGMVRSVLIDLSQTATINSSLQMGGKVLNQLGSFTNLHNNKVEQARFMVLKSPDIPSILVETGFISNPIEERNLTNPSYQMRLSQAIFQGIKGYFWENPPHGSRIEAMTSNQVHWVRSGETLPIIAAHYHVSIASLQSLNQLGGFSRIKQGQKLMIPSA